MSERSIEQIRELLDSLYRVDSGRILATLIRLLGDFDLAEEAMHEAFAAALSLWPRSGAPGNPRPWLISTARFLPSGCAPKPFLPLTAVSKP
jgi:RNA polymerase sigma-70 factor (ECF subfamily)